MRTASLMCCETGLETFHELANRAGLLPCWPAQQDPLFFLMWVRSSATAARAIPWAIHAGDVGTESY